ELNEKANVLAYKLREMGVKPDDFVAMLTEKSIEMIIGIYGIIKAGGVYVPMDPTYPEDRIKYMLEDSNPKAVIVYTDENIGVIDKNTNIIRIKDEEISVIDLADGKVFEGMSENPEHVNKPEDLVYCIYTSGTTGRPKGVMIENYSLINLCSSLLSKYTKYVTNAALVASYVFDASIQMIFSPILEGRTLHVISDDRKMDVSKLLNYYRTNRIDISDCTPSHLKMMLSIEKEIGIYVNTLLVGGEELPLDVAKEILEKEYCEKLINVYGPTECTVDSTAFEMNLHSDKVYIGKPVKNSKIYILNREVLCGIGMPGELCIAGVSLARGYLNRPELTEEKFVDNPYGEGRMYHTGDLARWLPDGNIEYLGRIDEQVKVRGFRVELGEIESRIREVSGVSDVAVIARADKSGDKEIYAYVVSGNDKELVLSDIRDELSSTLPGYMIPAYMMQIDSIPVTKNGKVDKNALPEIEAKTEKEYIAPENEVEKVLVNIFEEVLGVDRIGVNDDFFVLGGNSIKAMSMLEKIRKSNYNISFRELYSKKNIREIADVILKNSLLDSSIDGCIVEMLDPYDGLSKGKENDEIKRIISNYKNNIKDKDIINSFSPYFGQMEFILNSYKDNYNLVGEYKVTGISYEHLQKDLLEILKTQSVFRTGFLDNEKKLVEYDFGSWDIPVLNIKEYSREDIVKSLHSTISVNGDDILPIILVLQNNHDYEIFVSVNHALWDNMSMNVMYDLLVNTFNKHNFDVKEKNDKQTYTEYMNKKNSSSIELCSEEEKLKIYNSINKYEEVISKKKYYCKSARVSIPRKENEIYDFQWIISRYLKLIDMAELKEIPILVLYHGRNTKESLKNLGMYIELIPGIYNVEMNKVCHIDSIIDRLKQNGDDYRFIIEEKEAQLFNDVVRINIYENAESDSIDGLNEVKCWELQNVVPNINISLGRKMVNVGMGFKSFDESEEETIKKLKMIFEIEE
ncbi:MAG TPA: hypothetical protein DCW44_08270, partial [Eubacterium sp.]|nr:hypothetical protein [Eubacterium sp.]